MTHAAQVGVAHSGEASVIGPLPASAWAGAIVSYWKHAHACGQLDPTLPLELVDLAPGQGATVWVMLNAVLERAAQAALGFKPTLRYLACLPDAAIAHAWSAQPELAVCIESGTLVPVSWDAACAFPHIASAGGPVPWSAHNPVVFLAHDHWRALPQRLLAVHYGSVLEADHARLAESAGDPWTPVSDRPWDAHVEHVLQGYVARLNSSPIPVPVGAMGAIDMIAALAPRTYMILAAARGSVSERELRLGDFARVLAEYSRDRTLPVNFHLLSQHCRERGVGVWEKKLHTDVAIQVALGGPPELQCALATIVEPLDAGTLADSEALAQAMKAVVSAGNATAALVLLRHSRYDPAVLAAACPALHRRLLSSRDCDREAWAEALGRVWANHLPTAESVPLHAEMASCAMQIADWPLAKRILQRGMQARGERADDLAMLAWCNLHTGQLVAAQALAEQALARAPDHASAGAVHHCIRIKLSKFDDAWRRRICHPELPLVLEPLDVDHAAAFHRQYRDPQIAVMTGLPHLATLLDVTRWIEQRFEKPGERDYAVIHPEAGFVGYVGLHVSAAVGYFCFWTGVDHMGRGLAGQAGELLCRWALTQGIDWIFTTAYADNVRSKRALERIGFVAMRRGLSTDDRRYLCFTKRDPASREAESALRAYCRREDVPEPAKEENDARIAEQLFAS